MKLRGVWPRSGRCGDTCAMELGTGWPARWSSAQDNLRDDDPVFLLQAAWSLNILVNHNLVKEPVFLETRSLSQDFAMNRNLRRDFPVNRNLRRDFSMNRNLRRDFVMDRKLRRDFLM